MWDLKLRVKGADVIIKEVTSKCVFFCKLIRVIRVMCNSSVWVIRVMCNSSVWVFSCLESSSA